MQVPGCYGEEVADLKGQQLGLAWLELDAALVPLVLRGRDPASKQHDTRVWIYLSHCVTLAGSMQRRGYRMSLSALAAGVVLRFLCSGPGCCKLHPVTGVLQAYWQLRSSHSNEWAAGTAPAQCRLVMPATLGETQGCHTGLQLLPTSSGLSYLCWAFPQSIAVYIRHMQCQRNT